MNSIVTRGLGYYSTPITRGFGFSWAYVTVAKAPVNRRSRVTDTIYPGSVCVEEVAFLSMILTSVEDTSAVTELIVLSSNYIQLALSSDCTQTVELVSGILEFKNE